MNHIKDFFKIAKPGIIYSNLLTGLMGFFVASSGDVNFSLMLFTSLGLALTISSSTIINNYIDQDIDKIMSRTTYRMEIFKKLGAKTLLICSIILFLTGMLILFLTTNLLTCIIVLTGFIFYVVIYTMILKRTSVLSTLIGSISGGVVPMAGYTAVSGVVDNGAIILFLILVVWQMPHFYAIGIFRFNDYSNANIPILPIKEGITITKKHMFLWQIFFIPTLLSLYFFDYASIYYATIALLLSLWWLWVGLNGFKANIDDTKWAKKIFFVSIAIIAILSITIILDSSLILTKV
jgi:protoheme IX farnesyltransferase